MPSPTDPFVEMGVADQHVPDELYQAFLDHMPQVCVEVVLETENGILLAKRVNHPRIWFWPGGRLYKGETVEAAARRVARNELGIDIELRHRLGVYAHFWRPPKDGEPSRHTINLPYLAVPVDSPTEITLDDQHDDLRFVTGPEPWMHEYVAQYLRDLEAN